MKKGDFVELRETPNSDFHFPVIGDTATVLEIYESDIDLRAVSVVVYWHRLKRKGPWASPSSFIIRKSNCELLSS